MLPSWLELALWFDLGPVRPWEWPDIEAESWMEAIQIRGAWQAGIADAADEAAMTKRLAEMTGTAA